MKKALIITTSNYPNHDADAVRQHAFAKLLTEMGYDVFVIGYGNGTADRVEECDKIRYISLRPNTSNLPIRIGFRMLFSWRALSGMKKYRPDPDLIFIDYVGVRLMKKLKAFAAKKNILLIHNSMEWYSPEEFEKGSRDTRYIINDYINTKLINVPYKVVSISRYLDTHFRGQAVDSVRIPVIMDVENMKYDCEKHGDKTSFVYAGSPGRKDFLSEMIAGFALLPKDQLEKLVFHIIGVNRQQLIDLCGVSPKDIDAMGDALVVHGRLPREKTVHHVMNADYTVLLRDSTLRYAKAGFPTKVVESLACGTPVVSNLTSDLGLYLKDGENSVIIDTCSPQSVCEAVGRAIYMNDEHLKSMKIHARRTAETYFDYRRYVETMGQLIEQN